MNLISSQGVFESFSLEGVSILAGGNFVEEWVEERSVKESNWLEMAENLRL